jgi:hypothetical protein
MADSVTVMDLPVGFDLYGAYVDGAYKNFTQAEARFPGKVVGIAVFSTTNDGIVGDCENGDMTPQTSVNWVVMRRKAGVDPTIYCSESAWQSVKDSFATWGVTQPHYWIAGYPGSVGPKLYPGSVAHQFVDHGPYDESVVADFWPGVDKTVPEPGPPGPLPTKTNGDDMCVIEHTNSDGTVTRHVFGVVNGVAYHWYQAVVGPDFTWHKENLPL